MKAETGTSEGQRRIEEEWGEGECGQRIWHPLLEL